MDTTDTGLDPRPTSADHVLIFAQAAELTMQTWDWDVRVLARACRALFDAFRAVETAPDGDPQTAAALYRDWLFLEELTERTARAKGGALMLSGDRLYWAQLRRGICSDRDCDQPLAHTCGLCGKRVCERHTEHDHLWGPVCRDTDHYPHMLAREGSDGHA